MKIPSKSKYQIKIMDIYVEGSIIGQMVRNRTAQQAWEEMIQMTELRKAWYDHVESNKEVAWRTPIIGVIAVETKQELEKQIKEKLDLIEKTENSIEILMLDHELYLLYTSYGKIVYEENFR